MTWDPGWSGDEAGNAVQASGDSRHSRHPHHKEAGAMRKFLTVITALVLAVVVGVIIFRRLTEEQ
jgi:hypothetical protein